MGKLTNVYIPNSDSESGFTDNSDSDCESVIEDSEDSDFEITPLALIEGIANGNTENDMYRQLLQKYNVDSIDARDLIRDILESQGNNEIPEQIPCDGEPLSRNDCKLIFDVKSKNLTINEA